MVFLFRRFYVFVKFNHSFLDDFYVLTEAELMKELSKVDDQLHDIGTMSDVESEVSNLLKILFLVH